MKLFAFYNFLVGDGMDTKLKRIDFFLYQVGIILGKIYLNKQVKRHKK
jgi:hypothetical protein